MCYDFSSEVGRMENELAPGASRTAIYNAEERPFHRPGQPRFARFILDRMADRVFRKRYARPGELRKARKKNGAN